MILAALLVTIILAGSVWQLLRSRNMDLWIWTYLQSRFRPRNKTGMKPTHVYFCFCDHFEPYWHKATVDTARARVERWLDGYPRIAGQHRDSDGRMPQHSFFYPEEEYDEWILDGLAQLRSDGFGDVEVHLHHDNDTADHLRATLGDFTKRLHDRHGLLRRDEQTGQLMYCFIHGNWALDNSRPDGRWCGVDNELSVLVETGCRCDFTLPSAPSDTQTTKINSIYFARGEAGCRKSHNAGRDCSVGDWERPGELLLIQGPLALNWADRKFGLIPRIESSEISADAPPSSKRVDIWENCAVSVIGAEDHIFIKVHTHGAEDRTSEMLFSGGFDLLWTTLEARFRDRPAYALHYLTAWEMYEKVKLLCTRGRVA